MTHEILERGEAHVANRLSRLSRWLVQVGIVPVVWRLSISVAGSADWAGDLDGGLEVQVHNR